MKNRFQAVALVVLLLGVGAVALSWPKIDRWLQIDSCLDRGGCWDYGADACEFEDQTRCRRGDGNRVDEQGVPTIAYAAVVRSLADTYPGEGLLRFSGTPDSVGSALLSMELGVPVELRRPFCPGELRVWFDSARTAATGSYELKTSFASIPPRNRAFETEVLYRILCAEAACQITQREITGHSEVSLNIDPIMCNSSS